METPAGSRIRAGDPVARARGAPQARGPASRRARRAQRAVDSRAARCSTTSGSRASRALFTRRPLVARIVVEADARAVPSARALDEAPASAGSRATCTLGPAPERARRDPLAGRRRRIAVILSGGGARGAYEVGVLCYIFDELTRMRGAPPQIDILCGTSVGAINALLPRGAPRRPGARHAAARRPLERSRARRRARLWRAAAGRARVAARRRRTGAASSTCDRWPSSSQREISWRAVARCLRHGHLSALSVSCTEVSPGRTVVFMQTAPERHAPTTAPPRTLYPRGTDRPPARARVARRSRSSSRPFASTTSSTSTAASGRTRPSRPRCASARPTSSPSASRAR